MREISKKRRRERRRMGERGKVGGRKIGNEGRRKGGSEVRKEGEREGREKEGVKEEGRK